MFCENCGQQVDDNAAVCTNCGAAIKRNSFNQANSVPNPASVPMPKKYCKNCGAELAGNAAVCTSCGFAFGTGNSYCANCGNPTVAGQAVCTHCGSALGNTAFQGAVDPNAKSKMVAGLLGIFLGSLGIHNFYLGKTKRAIIQLCMSLISCGTLALVSEIWGLVEGIFYLTGHEGYTTDANGNPLKD